MRTAEQSRETWEGRTWQETESLGGGKRGAGQHLGLPGEPGKREGHPRAVWSWERPRLAKQAHRFQESHFPICKMGLVDRKDALQL